MMSVAKKRELINKETVIIIVLFITLAGLFLFNKINVYMSAESDGYFHALGGLFVHDLAKWWIQNPTLSFEDVKSFVIDYETRYKFFGGIGYYQPLHNIFTGMMAFFAGKQPIAFYLVTAIETILAIYFAYRLYRLMYGDKRAFLYLLILLIAFNPAVFNYGASYSLEPGVMLFSTVTLYYFIRFLRDEKRMDLYLTAAGLGLGIITKSSFVIVIPILIISAILEGKTKLFIRNPKPVLYSFFIFLIILSPWLGTEYMYSELGISKFGERIDAATIYSNVSILKRLAFLDITFIYVFGSFLAIPLLFYGIKRSKRAKGEITLISFIILYTLFYNILPNIQSRYLTAVVPPLMILVVRGIDILNSNHNRQRIFSILIGVLVLSQVLIALNYTTEQKQLMAATDVYQPALFINDNTDNRTTVLSTLSRMQVVPFVFIEDKNVNIVRAPFSREEGSDELRIMLDSSDYVKRPHKPEWEKFGMVHPPIEWVVVHERFDTLEPDYELKVIIDNRRDFELVKTFVGKAPDNRVFVYRRKPGIFY